MTPFLKTFFFRSCTTCLQILRSCSLRQGTSYNSVHLRTTSTTSRWSWSPSPAPTTTSSTRMQKQVESQLSWWTSCFCRCRSLSYSLQLLITVLVSPILSGGMRISWFGCNIVRCFQKASFATFMLFKVTTLWRLCFLSWHPVTLVY